MKSLILVLLMFFTVTAAFAGTPATTTKSGWITEQSANESLPYVVVDKNLDGYADRSGCDPVDKNWVKVFVTVSDDGKGHITGFNAILNDNRKSTIRHMTRNGGTYPVRCSFSVFNDAPFGVEVDPVDVRQGARILDLMGDAPPILGYVQ